MTDQQSDVERRAGERHARWLRARAKPHRVEGRPVTPSPADMLAALHDCLTRSTGAYDNPGEHTDWRAEARAAHARGDDDSEQDRDWRAWRAAG